MWPIVLIWTLVFLYVAKKYLDERIYGYWEERGVHVPKYWYFVGNFWEIIRMRKSPARLCTDIYKDYNGYNYVGLYKFTKPAVLVRSPELIKDIMVKNFKSFSNNDYDVHEKNDFILAKNPFTAKDEEWKYNRAVLTPNYNTSKVKTMMPSLMDNRNKLLQSLRDTCDSATAIEAKDLASKITCENFASCSMGIDGNSFSDPNSEFMKMGRHFNGASFGNIVKNIATFVCPPLSNLFKIRYFDEVLTNFFKKVVHETSEFRATNNVSRKDLLDSLNSFKHKIDDDTKFGANDVTAHIAGFFFDVFETSAIPLSYALFELSANPEIQNKLRQEIDNVEELTYATILEMTYLDWIIKETLRKHAPLPVLMKRCTQRFQLPPMFENSKGPTPFIEPGTCVILPVCALQVDEKYFSEPEEFRPERFADESDFVKSCYLPFGDGPRMCLGSKFALLQVKIAVATIIKSFELRVNDKTEHPIKMHPTGLFMAGGEMWIDILKRKN